MRRRLMLKNAAQAAPEHTYIAEATYNENCYVDANHVMHVNTNTYQGGDYALSPQIALESPISVVNGDNLVIVGSQTYRNHVNMAFYRNGVKVYYWAAIIPNATAINKTVSSPFTEEFDAIALSFGGGSVGMTAVNIKITKNGEEWLN